MTDSTLRNIMRFAAIYDVKDSISWEVDDNDNLLVYVVCDEFFNAETIDCQYIAEDTAADWQEAVIDANSIAPTKRYGSLLYCSRQRKLRPQGIQYDAIPELLWPLFDECGPARPIGYWNQHLHPSERTEVCLTS